MGERDDPYAGFADRYDRFYEPWPAYRPVEIAFFQKLFARHAVKRVLDCACGTGRHLPLFHTLGCEVIGSDISPSMLEQARQNLAALGLELPLHHLDYRDLPGHLEAEFDAVACLSSSILHMPTPDEVRRAFHSMAGVLREGGLLIVTQGTSDRQWREKPRFVLAVNRPDLTRLFAIDYIDAGARYHILDVCHGKEGQGLEVWTVDYPRIYLRDDYERLLKTSGFGTIGFYGTYDLDAYDLETSERLIVVARR